tara:strand:+ start:4775 stop:5569 length:795 start_codon:yes stop_codon:yes gene_type:complete
MNLIKPKKSLGQNFLIDKNIINLIVDSGNISENDVIFEVGSGTGNLTEKILSCKPKKIFTIEKDKILAKKLVEKFKDKVFMINEDILKINEKNLSDKPMIVFGNLPYNISTQILVKWIKIVDLNQTFKRFILMFQKEVGERIIAETNKKSYGRLSILTSWRMDVKKIMDVSPKSFFPVPKVKSTILLIEPKVKYYNLKNPKNLEYITNVFFNQRRKMIKKPISLIFKNANDLSNKLNINLEDRPQNLPPKKYFQICEEYERLSS